MTEYLKSFLKLIRWFHELLAVLPFVTLFFVIRYYVDVNGISCKLSGTDFFILCICVQLLIAAGCILNDIMDRKIDKINKPGTHIVGRTISLAGAKKLFALFTFLIVVTSAYIGIYIFREWIWISVLVYIFSILYDIYFKRTPLLGNILIAALASFIPLVLFFFAKECISTIPGEKIKVLIYLFSFFPFLVIIPRELSLDISDIEGDKAEGCRTLPIVIGVKKSKWFVTFFIWLIILLSVFVAYQYRYLSFTFLVSDILLIFYLRKLRKSETRIDYIKAGRFLWFIMILGLIGFAFSTIYL